MSEGMSKDLQATGTHAAANSAVTPGHVAPLKHFLPAPRCAVPCESRGDLHILGVSVL